MNPQTIFAKTPKGIQEVKTRAMHLPRELALVFLAIDGKSPAAALAQKARLDDRAVAQAIEKLVADGYIRALQEQPAAGAAGKPDESLDLDFTSPVAVAKLNAEATARAQAEAAAKARAAAAAREAAAAKARQEIEARARAQAEQKAQAEAQARLKAEQEARAAAQARAKAEAEAKAATEAKTRAEAEARARAALEIKARAEAEAKARAEAETRAKIEAEAKAKAEAAARAETEAATRAETEAAARASAEAAARSAVEAKMRAMEEAVRQAEERARAEAEARVRVEAEAKAHAEAEAKARAEAEARARAAEEAAAQARALAEAEAKARAEVEARAKEQAGAQSAADIEAAGIAKREAMAKAEEAARALAAAEAKAKVEAEARIAAEARAKEEAERRAHEEAEKLRRETELQVAREEAETRTRAEFKALEENIRRAREEAEAKIEVERKAREEAEAKAAAERKAREEFERKTEAEIAARVEAERKAREDAEAKAAAALRANANVERLVNEATEKRTAEAQKAQEEAEKALAAARIAHEQATAKAETETLARMRAEEKALAEKRARAAAEDRAKQETVARVMQEHQSRQRAEQEIQAKVEAEIKARQRAEIEAETRARTEAQKRADAAAARRAIEQKEKEAAQSSGIAPRKPVRWGRAIGIGLVVLIAVALGVLQILPLSGYVPGAQQLLSERLHQPVLIGNLRFSLVPFPQLRLENIAIGAGQEIKIASAVIPVDSPALLQDSKDLSEVQLADVDIDPDALPWLAGWAGPQSGSPLHIGKIDIKTVKLALPQMELPPFNAAIQLGPDNALRSAKLYDSALSVELQPAGNGSVRADFNATSWTSPVGPPFQFSNLTGSLVANRQHAVVDNLDGRLYGGALSGSVTVQWAGGLNADGKFVLKGVDLEQLLPIFTRDFVASGALDAGAQFSMQGQTPAELFAAPRIDATFTLQRGALNNLDIVRALQNPGRGGIRGGKTSFNEISGEFQAAGNRLSYRDLKINSGPMSATGAVDVSGTSELSGRLNAQVASQTTVIARGIINVGGSVKDPLLNQ